jgi:hypothetical protein
MSIPRLLSLAEAAKLLSADGKITARSLRTEARHGRLGLVRVAGKDFVTPQSLADMVTAATTPVRPQCPAPSSLPASSSSCAACDRCDAHLPGSLEGNTETRRLPPPADAWRRRMTRPASPSCLGSVTTGGSAAGEWAVMTSGRRAVA